VRLFPNSGQTLWPVTFRQNGIDALIFSQHRYSHFYRFTDDAAGFNLRGEGIRQNLLANSSKKWTWLTSSKKIKKTL